MKDFIEKAAHSRNFTPALHISPALQEIFHVPHGRNSKVSDFFLFQLMAVAL